MIGTVYPSEKRTYTDEKAVHRLHSLQIRG